MSRSYVTFEKIGTCELCGATDHHLIEGVCPACRPKVKTVQITMCGASPRRESLSALSRMVAASVHALKGMSRAEEESLGAEASVSHVRVPKGRAR